MGSQHPKSIHEAVELLLSEFPKGIRKQFGTSLRSGFSLHFSLGNYIRNGIGLWQNNEEFLKARCHDSSPHNADDPSWRS